MNEKEEKLMESVDLVQKLKSEIETSIKKEEVDKLINSALEESKHYTEVLLRRKAREQRREENMIRTISRKGEVGLILLIISGIILYLCESSIKNTGDSNFLTVLMIIGVVILVVSGVLFIITTIRYENFYRTLYTICYKETTNEGNLIKYCEYVTKASSPEKALKRFYRVNRKRNILQSVTMVDEFGVQYNKEGKPIEVTFE